MSFARPAGGHPGRVDFGISPFLVIWETTRSCALACRHCRAEAIFRRDPEELDTREGFRLIDQTAELGAPILILSGGDPLNRPDLEELIRRGKSRGLRMGTIPAATGALSEERVRAVRDAGCDQIAFSLDGPTPELHDGFRGVPGAFVKTMEGVRAAREAGLPLQINTCFAAWNFQYLEEMIALVRGLGIVFWEVFFLIPTGRGRALESLSAEQFERVFERLHRLSGEESFIVKLTEAQHYRRFVIQAERARGGSSADSHRRIRHALARPRGVAGSFGQSPQAVNAGKGFVFVDHRGEVYPSGFLPVSVGSVKTSSLAELYREAPLMRGLREPERLKGKCGACEFRALCGGSRARAYALTGDPYASDPFCAYQPAVFTEV